MPIADWNVATDNAWDFIAINGTEIKGCRVEVDGETGRDYDVKKQKGKDGATYTDNGVEPAPIKITISALTKDKADEVQAILDKIDPRSKGNVGKPVTLTHPATDSRGVTAVLIQKIKFPKISKGVCVFDIQCIEHKPIAEKKNTGKGKAKQAATVGYQDPAKDVNDVNAYYNQQQQEASEDLAAGRITGAEYGNKVGAIEADRQNAVNDIMAKNQAPASKDNSQQKTSSWF